MADNTETGSADSANAVALKLWQQIRQSHGTHARCKSIEEELRLFLACRRATVRGQLDVDNIPG